ncbi:MAG: helix-turn-helix domain-containing protein [Candidatus Heteroscillospira sp.]
MTLGEKLKMHRIRKGLSQEKAAELVGVSRQAVTKWENDQTVPSSGNLIELAAVYAVSLDELAADKQSGKKTDKKILRTNLTLIAIISQAAFLNAAMRPSQITEDPKLKAIELAVKLIPLAAASVWMSWNLRYEANTAQRQKNTGIELLYCLVQLSAMLFGYYSKLYFVGTALILSAVLLYIFIINPRYMNRRLTRPRKK